MKMPRPDSSPIFAYLTTIPSIIGIAANIILLILTVFKTPPSLRTYSRILMSAALCDLIGAFTVPCLVTRSISFPEATVLDSYGLCSLTSVDACWLCTGLIEMLIPVNDAFICVSFYYRLMVIRGDQTSVKSTFLTIIFVMFVHTPLFFGYFATQRKWHNIAEETEDIELIDELRVLTHYGILKFFDPITLTVIGWTILSSQIFFGSAMYLRWKTINGLELSKNQMSPATRSSHLMLITALNVQLLILIGFVMGSCFYMSAVLQITRSYFVQFAIFPVSSLQFTLSPIANIIFIKPYRSNSMSTFTTIVNSIEGLNTLLGLFLNLLLLYAIRKFSRAHLGAYKHLLTIFTLVDLFLVILHILLRPRVLRAGNTHGTVTDTIFDDMRVTALYIGCQSVPFTLLGIHFLYRYWSVRSPHLIQLFSRTPFVIFLATLTNGVLISWYFLSMFSGSGHDISAARMEVAAEYESKYGKRIENAWILFDHWRDNNFDAVLFVMIIFMNVIMITSLIAAASFAILTFHHIKNSQKLSTQTNELQRKLLIALCAQATVPSLFVYVPYLACIDLPFLRIPGTIFHDACASCFTFFPVWDAAIIILLFSDYRSGLAGIVWKKKQISTAHTTLHVTSTVQMVSSVI